MDNLQKVLSIVRFVMGLMYVALGLFLVLKPEGLQNIIENPQHVQIFGGAIIFYGGFRLYRAYKTQAAAKD